MVMTDAEFDKHIDEKLGIRPDGKIDLMVGFSTDCHCDINIPFRPMPPTPEERLLEHEDTVEWTTWGCYCTLSLQDCYWLLKLRREVQALSSNG